eukprot:403358939
MRKQLVYTSRRFQSNNWTFQKGKLSMQKLKDKATIDAKIDQINLVFPDQFGRLTGLKLNAEYFIETIENSKRDNCTPFFEYKYNPFRFDVLGKPIDFKDTVQMPKSIRLTPDLDTMREQPWLQKQAVVMANVHQPDSDEIIRYAPRNMLKQVLEQRQQDIFDECQNDQTQPDQEVVVAQQKLDKIKTQILFSFVLHKYGKDDKEQHHNSNKGMLTLEQGWGDILEECRKHLRDIGIPIQSNDQTQVNNQFRFHLREVDGDLLGQCDMFHTAKHAMKYIGYQNQYDISTLPIDSSNNSNDLILNIKGRNLHPSEFQNVLFFAPNVNSVRRLRMRKNGDIFKQKGEQSYEVAITAPDSNLYLAISSLLQTKAQTDKELVMPRNYQEAVTLFDQYKDQMDEQVYKYYKALFEHELKELDENFNKWEVNRIY